jgi:hypothetical protein
MDAGCPLNLVDGEETVEWGTTCINLHIASTSWYLLIVLSGCSLQLLGVGWMFMLEWYSERNLWLVAGHNGSSACGPRFLSWRHRCCSHLPLLLFKVKTLIPFCFGQR